MDCLFLKVSPNEKISQHLKEGVMPRCVANVIQIIGFYQHDTFCELTALGDDGDSIL